ncbi:MAG: hypothetical protein R2810_13355 [Flavobacteriales bacterium]
MESLRHFKERGASFLKQPDVLQRQLFNVKALLFDWDGVFNEGFKDEQGGSPFSEVDSMGVNMLRFGLWRTLGKLPPTAIITGQHNHLAQAFAEREHLDRVYMGFANKPAAFDAFLGDHGLQDRDVAFFFDDILDLPVARRCSLRILIGHQASPMMELYARDHNDADYVTASSGGDHGVREGCELMLALWSRWDEVVDNRLAWSDTYQRYLTERNAVVTEVVRQPRWSAQVPDADLSRPRPDHHLRLMSGGPNVPMASIARHAGLPGDAINWCPTPRSRSHHGRFDTRPQAHRGGGHVDHGTVRLHFHQDAVLIALERRCVTHRATRTTPSGRRSVQFHLDRERSLAVQDRHQEQGWQQQGRAEEVRHHEQVRMGASEPAFLLQGRCRFNLNAPLGIGPQQGGMCVQVLAVKR